MCITYANCTVYHQWKYSGNAPIIYAEMKMFSTATTNETFSFSVTVFASFHLVLSRSTDTFMRCLYLSSCSSGCTFTRFRHSSTTVFLLDSARLASLARCRRTFSAWLCTALCIFSNRWGSARFSSMSNMVRRSTGGKSFWPKDSKLPKMSAELPVRDKPGVDGVASPS